MQPVAGPGSPREEHNVYSVPLWGGKRKRLNKGQSRSGPWIDSFIIDLRRRVLAPALITDNERRITDSVPLDIVNFKIRNTSVITYYLQWNKVQWTGCVNLRLLALNRQVIFFSFYFQDFIKSWESAMFIGQTCKLKWHIIIGICVTSWMSSQGVD